MTATSVTGRGLGSADGQNKGSEHMTLGVGHLIGPRVVIADSHTMDGSSDTLVLPVLDGTVGDYIVTATDADTTSAVAVAASLAMDATSTTLTLFAAATGLDIAYSIIKKGIAI